MSVDIRLNAPPTRSDAELLPSVPTREELALLAAAGVARAVLPGEQLFRRGDEAQSMYLIDTGQVRLVFEDGLADKILSEGQYFGELSVFVGEHLRFGSAVAETECVLFEITSASFASLLDREPAIMPPGVNVMRACGKPRGGLRPP